ncbi:MAG: radical SAM protein [Nitrospiraceae bacterium]|nr:radical SAM protein [Nitrospiraceae bacterium]
MMPSHISLRLSVTAACQLRCCYCRPERDGGQVCAGACLQVPELVTLVRHLHTAAGIAKLRFTGGEPLLRKDLPEVVAACGGLGIGDVALTTNGQRLVAVAEELKRGGLHRVNISLDSLNGDTFAAITRGGNLASSLAGIEAALAKGLRPVKLNMVVMRDLNDHEVGDMLDFALDTGCHIRFLELMPIGEAAREFGQRFVGWRETYERIAGGRTFRPSPYRLGATSRDYDVQDARGRKTVCGFISPSSRPFCRGCNRLRLTADGRLLGCLAHRRYLDLRPALRLALAGDLEPLASDIHEAFSMKRQNHDLADQREMAAIGG